MEDQKYEWFIRSAYKSGRNASIGADVNYWRGLVHANNVFIGKGLPNPSEELINYNGKEIQIRQFIGHALSKYQEQSHFNTHQKEKLKLLNMELNTLKINGGGFGVDYLASVMERASKVMESDLEYDVLGTGLFESENFLQPSREEIYLHRNFFGRLETSKTYNKTGAA